MKKLLIHCKRCSVLLLALTAAFAVGCTGDLEDDIADLNGQYEDLNDQVGDLQSQVDALEDKLADNIFIKSIDGTVITFSDNTTLDVEDLLIITENDEFYVLEVNGEYIVAYKDGVVFPSDVSLPNTSLINLTLVRGQEYSFYVQIDPTDVTIEPSNVYLVSFIDNLVPDTKADDSDETAGFTIHGDSVVMRAQATSIYRDETKDGRYIATAVWTEADCTVDDFADWKKMVSGGDDLYVSVEYPVYTWDEEKAEAVRGYKWILSDDTTKYDEIYVAVVDDDIQSGEIVLHFTEGDVYSAASPYTFNVEDYIVSDFISGNLNSVEVLNGSKLALSADDIDEKYEIQSGFAGDKAIFTWGTKGAYKNNTGADATVDFVTNITEVSSYGMTQQPDALYTCDDDVCDDEIIRPLMFEGYLAFEDKVNYGISATTAFTGVTRPLTIYVHDIDTVAMNDAVTALVPNTADGAVATKSYDSADDAKSQNSTEQTSVYETRGNKDAYGFKLQSYTPYGFHGDIDDFAVTYTPNGGTIVYTEEAETYGYVYDNLSETAYNTYLNQASTIASFIETTVSANSHHIDSADVECDITLANTASQALLPGKYWVYANVDMTYTDEDGEVVYTGSKVFAQRFDIYAPQYTMELQPQIRTQSPYMVQEQASAENYFDVNDLTTTTNYKQFTTYEWYDFDFARFVDVTTVDGWVNSASGLHTNYAYEMIDGSTTSTVYTDLELALYDYNTAAEYLGLRFSKENASTELVGSSVKWYPGLYADVAGTTVANLIEVDALTASSTDVSKVVTFYVKLLSGLKVPVQIVDYDPRDVYENDAQGASENSNILDADDEGTMVFNININGLAANLVEDVVTPYTNSTIIFDWTTYSEERGEFPDYVVFNGSVPATTYDYSDALSDVANRYQVYVFPGEITREVPTYLNLLKDTFRENQETPRFLHGSVGMFTNIVNFYNRDYSENVTTELSDACAEYVVAAVAALGYGSTNVETDDVKAYPELYTTYIAAYEERYGVSAYTTSTNHMRAGIIESQIGDGSSDRSGTVDLIASITYAVSELRSSTGAALATTDAAYGLKVISIDNDGFISPVTSTTLPTNVKYSVVVTATITDVAGNVVTAEETIVLQY